MTGEYDVIHTCVVADELVTDEGALVLLEGDFGHRVLRLSPVGQLIRELAADGISFDRLVAELESRLGPAPSSESRSLVERFVAALEVDGVVERTLRKHAHS